MAEQRHFPFVIANDILVGKGPIDYEEPIINIAKLILNNLKSQPNFVAQVDWVLLETQMCIEIANSDMLQKYDFSCLKRIIYSGAEIPYYNYTDLTLSLPNTIIVALYYTIETGIISYQSTNNKIKSSGHIGKNVMLKIIDIDTYDPVGPNVCGEICCYCVSMARTYIYNKTDHSLFSRDGWLHTNDTGYYDEDGEIFVMGRKIDFIMFRDYLYSPAIIENFISRYSTVDKVAVLGIMNAQGTKHPTAYILTKPEQHIDATAVFAEMDAKLDDHMKLRGGMKLLNEMPYALDGTIDRLALCNEEYREHPFTHTTIPYTDMQ
ncbi:Luciferin 4-monooxygenase [Harpegnathos saltator]|uniref:Luciferin 4-monooxygenase n=1 Tax=Harpegnathos saltator TaxID=610380 RepID=E2BAQ0_HARSA|nr:Luciferin 4-monooxygenase [Harpegnathos saltator]